MKILLYTDCMSIDNQVAEENRYPALLKKFFKDDEIVIIDLDGMTTFEAQENIYKVIEQAPDIVIYAFGVNDALPRGLTRKQRGAIIRWSYKVNMSKKMRHNFRTYFLNPLEYVMQLITKPKHYFTVQELISHIDFCMNNLHQNGVKTALINIAPVSNYRFIHAKKHIALYNKEIENYCIDKSIHFVDAYRIFMDIGLDKALAKDKFHYAAVSHKRVAEELISIIKGLR